MTRRVRKRLLGILYEELRVAMMGRWGPEYDELRTEQDRVFQVMSRRNERARELERAGRIDEAIPLYEQNVDDMFFGSFPYDRLRIIYTRQKRFGEAIRVSEAYLALPDKPHGQDKERVQQHRDKLRAKLGLD